MPTSYTLQTYVNTSWSDMSELLGRQDCIESLRKDVVDLQGAILDVFSRTGPVRFSSWKFPDKLSCNLDMAALLEQYDFVDGDDAFNQHSHIVLLELLTDRLLLLLQSFNAYVEQMRCSRREQTPQRGCLSVGLVVRNYWSNLVQFSNFKMTYKDIKKQGKVKISDCDETETVSSQMSPSRRCSSAWSSTSSLKSFPHNHLPSSEADSHSVSCQTIESSLVPCNACYQVQSTLIKTGHALVGLLQNESLPSSLQPLSAAVEDTLEMGHMAAGDVAQWATEQLRDMRRLGKHLQDVRGTVQPLQDRLEATEAERDRFRSQLDKTQKEFKQEVEKQQVNTVQLEFSLRKAERATKEMEQRLQEEQRRLKTEALCLEESNSRLKEKVAAQQDAIQALEGEINVLQAEVRSLHAEEEARCTLQQRIQQLESQISETELRLDKESAKYHSACRQQESMQAKQKSLLERADALDEECEELQRQLGESEGGRIDLHDQLQQISEEREQMKAQLAQQQELCLELQKEKKALETHEGELKSRVAELEEHVQDYRNRERLLVAFPELSPLALAQPQSTGSVLLDMERQLQANNIRMDVLEQENTSLYSSLLKLRERAQNDGTREASPQQTQILSVPSIPSEKQNPTTTRKSPFRQSSSATALGYNNRSREGRRGESGSEDGVFTVPASPSSLQLHLQTLHLNTDSTSVKKHSKTCGGSLLSGSRSSNQRKNPKP